MDLSTYVRVGRYDLPEPTRTAAPANSVLAQEASAVTYNWDTDTLFVVGDGGTSVVQVSKTGELINSMTLAPGSSPQGSEFYDPEGLAYVGAGKFVMTEERDRNAVQFEFVADSTLTRAQTQTVNLGTNVGNVGLEGLTFDPATGGFIFVKEATPQGIFQADIDFEAGTASNGSPTTENSVNLFDPAMLGLLDIADVFALSNVPSVEPGDAGHLLVLSHESGTIVETDREGIIYSSLTILSDPGNPLSVVAQQHEGLTVDSDGFLYVVSENGGGDFDHPQLWVYAPSNGTNTAPAALALTNPVASLDENTSTAVRIKVADVVVTDDGLGTNVFSLTGADAAWFKVDSTGLYVMAGTVLDFENRASYSVTVNTDDASVGSTPDASADYTLSIADVANESGSPALYISEVAPWSSGNSPVGADWFEVTNGGSSAIDITGWQMDDSSASLPNAVALTGIGSIAAGESVIFLETDDLAASVGAFVDTWFGGIAPVGLRFGAYDGGGIGLSTGGDAINLYNGTGALQASVSFGASPEGPFSSFNNAAALNNAAITTMSAVGQNGTFAAAGDPQEIGSPGTVGRLIISEVAPWSSGDSPVEADWFEVTNTSAFAIDISGWKMDDSSGSPAGAVALTGITTIAAGESVILLETDDLAATSNLFMETWFGGNPPANLQIGAYSGGGVGLSTGGDAVHLYNAAGVLQASLTFGASPEGPFASFDNAAGANNATVAFLSSVGVNGAFVAQDDADAIGSPGEIVAVNDAPVAADDALSSAGQNAGARTISFASLLANDLAGPANESGQTLTITAVANAVGGTVSIVGTNVLFTPIEGFTGEARFDYVVSDDGTSYGVAAPLTDTASASFVIKAGEVIVGGPADEMLAGTVGNDMINAGGGNDEVQAGNGNDVAIGGNGNDMLDGGDGADTLFGDDGRDTILGGAGIDTIAGGGDKDWLTGDAGADIFVFAVGDSKAGGGVRDVVTDFQAGVDKLDLSALGITDFAAQISFKTVGSGLIVYADIDHDGLDYGDFGVQLTGLEALQLADFILV